MEVILKQAVEKLGNPLDIVKVADGFARNFLIPRGLAVLATEGNKKTVSESLRLRQAREERENKKAKTAARKIESVSLTIPVKVGEDDKLFGSVTPQNIADALANEGYPIDKRDIEMEEPIKELGVYTVPVRLSKSVAAKVKVWVVKEAQ